jgi:hypothetical protein
MPGNQLQVQLDALNNAVLQSTGGGKLAGFCKKCCSTGNLITLGVTAVYDDVSAPFVFNGLRWRKGESGKEHLVCRREPLNGKTQSTRTSTYYGYQWERIGIEAVGITRWGGDGHEIIRFSRDYNYFYYYTYNRNLKIVNIAKKRKIKIPYTNGHATGYEYLYSFLSIHTTKFYTYTKTNNTEMLPATGLPTRSDYTVLNQTKGFLTGSTTAIFRGSPVSISWAPVDGDPNSP